MSELGRRSARLANSNQPMKPLGVCNALSSYERRSLSKSPNSARKTLFENESKENEDYALGKEFSSKRDNTGKSPVAISNSKSSNDTHEKKKVKPRRSMLGHRSKTQLSNYVKDDATFTISKPLRSSSPNKVERMGGYNYGDLSLKPISRKSISTPQLTPFDSDDIDRSAFFDKGISDSAWSVFKSEKKKSVFEPPLTRRSLMPGKARCIISESDSELNNSNSNEAGKSSYDSIKPRMPRKSLIASVDQEVKLKWLSQKFQMGRSNLHGVSSNENMTRNIGTSEDEYSSENAEFADHSDDQENGLNNTLTLNEFPSPIENLNNTNQENLNDSSSANSTDSYILHETTILNSGKNNLDKIEEEKDNRDFKDSSCKKEEPDDNDEDDHNNIHRIMNLFEDLKNDKDVMDAKWSDLMEQRDAFETKWNHFNFLFRAYERNITSQKNLVGSSSVQEKPRKAVPTKLRPSFVNPANICLKLPKTSSNSSSSDRYSEKKTNFNCKTPVRNDKLLKKLRKSTCYTPNSLSIMVDDQAKDIFGSDV